MKKLQPSPIKVDRNTSNTNGMNKETSRLLQRLDEDKSPGSKLNRLNLAHSQAVLPGARPEASDRALTGTVNMIGRRQSDNGLPTSDRGENTSAFKAGFAAPGDRNSGIGMLKQT